MDTITHRERTERKRKDKGIMSDKDRQLLIYSYRKYCSMVKKMTDARAAENLTTVAINNGWCEERKPLKGGALVGMSKKGGSKVNSWMVNAAYHYLLSENYTPKTEGESMGFEFGRRFFEETA